MNLNTLSSAIMVGVLPSLLWLFFFLREDRHHTKPRGLIFTCFIGGVMAVLISIFAEKIIADFIVDSNTRYTYWAAFEELIKFVVVSIIALHTRANEDPLDPMIYCITVALGFAALENTLFILTPLSNGSIAQALVTGNMRFIGATLVHVLSSATIGFTLGYVFYRSWFVRFLAGIIGIIGAITLHASFNLSIINATSEDTLRTFGWVWGAVVVLIILFEEVKAVHKDGMHAAVDA